MKRLVLVAGIALAGCVEQEIDGGDAFYENCAGCHGLDGRGNGSVAAQLGNAPPDLTTLAARNGGVFPRDYVMSTIDGYHRDEGFAPEMPEFGAGDMGELVMLNGTPVPARLLALAFYVETLQRPVD